jgi:hypothetical protein
LEECEEKFGLRVSSCQRQFDNLKRVRDAVHVSIYFSRAYSQIIYDFSSSQTRVRSGHCIRQIVRVHRYSESICLLSRTDHVRFVCCARSVHSTSSTDYSIFQKIFSNCVLVTLPI